MKHLISILAILSLTGCAVTSQTFDDQGRVATHIACGSAAFGTCLKKADEVCPHGYYTVDKNADWTFFASEASITVRCK